MAPRSTEQRFCPWCLIEVSGARCPFCRERPRGPDDVALTENYRFSGQVVADRYRVTRFIGAGGMGEVYKAYDKRADRMVAIKFLLPLDGESRTDNIKSHRRFTQECEILARLESPYVVRFLDDERTADGTPALVMELLRGQTLHRLLSRNQQLRATEIVDIAVPVCRALQAAHARNYVHRDLKPANIFLHDPGDGSRVVKVLDFGIAKIIDEEHALTKKSHIVGTLEYMSPEHCGRGDVSPRSDLFSLGTILYQMTTGTLPFRAPGTVPLLMAIANEPPAPISPDLNLPSRLLNLVMDLLNKDPSSRPKDALEVEERLTGALEERPSETVRLSREGLTWLEEDQRPTVPIKPVQASPPAAAVEARDTGKPEAVQRPRDVEQSSPSPRDPEAFGDPKDAFPTYRPPNRRWLAAGLVAALVLLPLLSWQGFLFATTTRVRTLKTKCQELAFENVNVSGTVMNAMNVPLTGVSAYKLSDGNASIWVLSDYNAPPSNTSLRIKAIVIESEALDYVCEQDAPPEECPLLKNALKVLSGECVLVELER